MLTRIWVRLSGGWWRHRQRCLSAPEPWRTVERTVHKLYVRGGAGYVSFTASFAGRPILPHQLLGVFIAPGTNVGRDVTIHQHVMLIKIHDESSPRYGSPTIGDEVFIGAGAKVLGAVTVGAGARLGAGVEIVKDVPPGATVVNAPAVVILHDA